MKYLKHAITLGSLLALACASDECESGGDGCETGGSALSCAAARDETDCRAQRCKVLAAHLVDTAEQCAEREPVYAGCVEPGCPAMQVTAVDPDGTQWFFGDGCTPPGWLDRRFTAIEWCAGGSGGSD
jgi:hypothetical protein